jgi:hypothetical protein
MVAICGYCGLGVRRIKQSNRPPVDSRGTLEGPFLFIYNFFIYVPMLPALVSYHGILYIHFFFLILAHARSGGSFLGLRIYKIV